LQLAGKPFSDIHKELKQKERKDAMGPKSKKIVQRYCHNDNNAHCFDSFNLDDVKEAEGQDS